MLAGRIVEHLNIVEHVLPCCVACEVGLPSDPFAFQEMEEAFWDRVVMTIFAAAHTGIQIVFIQERLPLFASELRPLIGVDHRLCLWFTSPYGTQ